MAAPRVLHLIATFGPGGAERQLSLLAPAMVAAGAEVAIAFHQGGANLDRLHGTGVTLRPVPQRRHHDPRIIGDLHALMRQWRPDLVQTWLLQMDVMGGLAARWAGVPHVLSERSSAALYTGGWKMGLRALLGRHARAIVANSRGGVDYWRSQGARGSLHVIANGLSPADHRPPADDLGLAEVPLIISAGRLSFEKNVPGLIAALAAALQRLPDHHAVVFGDGPERALAQQLIEATPVAARLHLGGFSDRLGYWLRRARVFVSASHLEGHPNAVIEAAAEGCPLVLSDIPAHREVVDDRAALFAAPGDASQLAERIVEAATHPAASQARARLAQAATAHLQVEQAAARYVALYRELLAS